MASRAQGRQWAGGARRAAAPGVALAVGGPPLAVCALTLAAEPLAAGLGEALGVALWNGLLVLGVTLAGHALWRRGSRR